MSNQGKDAAEAIAAIILGIIGGIILAAILAALSAKEYRCPSCNGAIKQGISFCPHCNSEIRWD